MKLFQKLLVIFLLSLEFFNPAFSTSYPQPTFGFIPTGGVSAVLINDLLAEPGVPIESFFVTGDADYTAAFNRAVTAGVAIQLGPKTYTVNNFSTGSVTKFIIKGIPGQSIIQMSGTSSDTITLNAATVYVDGVIFDLNGNGDTGVSRGVVLSAGGQTVVIRNSVFKNNLGGNATCFSLTSNGPAAGGSFTFQNNEVASCGQNGAAFLSVSNGLIDNVYAHDNTLNSLLITANGSASSTNYATNIVLAHNHTPRALAGIHIGTFLPPYTFGTPAATKITAIANLLEDNSSYQLSADGDYLVVSNNIIGQNSASPAASFGGILCNARFSVFSQNTVKLTGSHFGMDCGGGVRNVVTENLISVDNDVGIDPGGNENSTYARNKLLLSGTAIGMVIYPVESDGNNVPFPTIASNTEIVDNSFYLADSSSAAGINFLDNAGGYTGAFPMVFKRNHFYLGSGIPLSSIMNWYGNATSIAIDGNDVDGTNIRFDDPNGSGDVVFEPIYFGGTIYAATTTTTNIRSITTNTVETYGGGGSILFVTPSAGGSGYTSATTLSASGGGGTGWTGVPLISGGVITSVRTTAFGSGYSGTITITATDSGGGTGATFTVGNFAVLPNYATMKYVSTATHLLQKSGGFSTLNINASGIMLDSTTTVTLQSKGGLWGILDYTLPSIAVGSLPACSATYNGVVVNITGSASNKWQGRCNGTNWLWPDGTTVS